MSGLGHICLDPFSWAFHWIWPWTASGLGPTSSHRPGWWGGASLRPGSSSRDGMLVVCIPLQLHLCACDWGSSRHWALLHLSVASSPMKLAKSAWNCGVSPRLSGRSNQTCFGAGFGGKHLRVDLGREPKYPAVDIGTIPGCTRLTSLSWDPHCWSCRCKLLKEWCRSSSSHCGHGRFSGREAYQEALLHCGSPSNGPQCCCILLLWYKHLCLDWEHLIVESPLSCLALVASGLAGEQEEGHRLPPQEAWGHSWLCTEPVGGDWLAQVWLCPWGCEAEVSSHLPVLSEGHWGVGMQVLPAPR